MLKSYNNTNFYPSANSFKPVTYTDSKSVTCLQRIISSENIANQILKILSEKQLLQKDFALLLGKSEAEISRWLSGSHNFTIKTISKIELALQESIILIPG